MTRSSMLALVILLLGCGGGGPAMFSPTFPDNREPDVGTVLARLRTAPARDDAPIAVGITAAPAKLFAFDLAGGRMLWERPVQARTAPHLAGDLVVVQEASGVVARDLRSGAERFTVDDEGLRLVGADGAEGYAAVTLSTGGGVGARSRVIVAEGGSRSWELEVEHALGAPAIAGGMVFLPWGSQNVSVFDAETSNEIARVRITDEVIGHALVHEGHVYLGQSGIFRLTPSIVSGTKARAAYFGPQLGELPGRPAFLLDAYQPPPEPASAVHKVRLAWRPSGEGEEVGLAGDRLYLVFYRLVFALHPRGDGAHWVHEHPADVVGTAVVGDGLLVADEGGRVSLLGGDGRPVWEASLGVRPTVVRLRAGSFSPGGAPQGDAMVLRDQLLAAAQSTDARLVPARVLSVRLLAQLPEPEVTGNLVAICEQRNAPQAVRSGACLALADRTTGSEHVITALSRHAAFLEGTSAPPVGALARAAVGMQERRAIPLLIAHLRDPETPVEDLPALVAALEDFADRTAAEPIEGFLRLYHADVTSEHLANALGTAADALVALSGPVAADALREIAEDPLGADLVRARASRALATLSQQTQQAEQADAQAQADQQRQNEEGTQQQDQQATPPPGARPEQLDAAIVGRVLEPVAAELRNCLRNDARHPASARVVIATDGDGRIEMISVTPPFLQACVEPLVRSQTFPGTRRATRQQVTHVIRN